jgi:hypothetical protein
MHALVAGERRQRLVPSARCSGRPSSASAPLTAPSASSIFLAAPSSSATQAAGSPTQARATSPSTTRVTVVASVWRTSP